MIVDNCCVVLVSGVSPKPIIDNVSKRAYSQMPPKEKARFARYPDTSWIQQWQVTTGARVEIDEARTATILSYVSEYKRHRFEEIEELLSGKIVTTIPAAICWGDTREPDYVMGAIKLGGERAPVQFEQTLEELRTLEIEKRQLRIAQKKQQQEELRQRLEVGFTRKLAEKAEEAKPNVRLRGRAYYMPTFSEYDEVGHIGAHLHTRRCAINDFFYFQAKIRHEAQPFTRVEGVEPPFPIDTPFGPLSVEQFKADRGRCQDLWDQWDQDEKDDIELTQSDEEFIAHEADLAYPEIGHISPAESAHEDAHCESFQGILCTALLVNTVLPSQLPGNINTHELASPQMFSIPNKIGIAADKITNVCDGVNNMTKEITTLASNFANFLKNTFPQYVDDAFNDALLFVDFVKSMYSNDIYTFCMSCLRLLTRLKIPSTVVQTFANCMLPKANSTMNARVEEEDFTSCFESLTEQQPKLSVREDLFFHEPAHNQSGFGIGSIFLSLIGIIVTGAMPSKTAMKSVREYCQTYNSMLPTVSNLSELLPILPDLLPSICDGWVSTLCPEVAWKKFVEYEYSAFHEKVRHFNQPEVLIKLKHDPDVQKQFMRLRELAKKYIETVINKPQISPKLAHFFANDCKILDKLDYMVQVANGESVFRQVPFSVWISGPPNQGKSLMALALCKLLRPKGWEADANLVYPRDLSDEFYSRYNGQHCIYFDDAFAFNDEQMAKMVAEFLTIVSNIPKGLNMPSLDDPTIGIKGMRFQSEVVVITTNVPFPKPVGMAEPRALWRRKNCHWVLNVKPEFCVGGVPQYHLLTQEQQDTCSYLTWRLHDSTNEDPNAWLTPEMSTEQAMLHTLKCYQFHTANQDNLMKMYKKIPIVEKVRGDFFAMQEVEEEKNKEIRKLVGPLIGKKSVTFHEEGHSEGFTDIVKKISRGWRNQGHERNQVFQKVFQPGENYVRNEVWNLKRDEEYTRSEEIWYDAIGGGEDPEYEVYKHRMEVLAKKQGVALENPSGPLRERKDPVINDSGELRVVADAGEIVSERFSLEQQLKQKQRIFGDEDDGIIQSVLNELDQITGEWMIKHPWISTVITFCAGVGVAFAISSLVSWAIKGTASILKGKYEDVKEYYGQTKEYVLPCLHCKCDSPTVKYDPNKPCECSCHQGHSEAATGRGYEQGKGPNRRVKYNNRVVHERARRQQFERFLEEVGNTDYDSHTANEIEDFLPQVVRLYMPDFADRQLTAFRFSGTFALVPYHFFCGDRELVPEGTSFQVIFPGGPVFDLKFERRHLYELDEIDFEETTEDKKKVKARRHRDACVYDLGPRIPAAPLRVKRFMTREDYGHHNAQAGAVLTTRLIGDKIFHHTIHTPKVYYQSEYYGDYNANDRPGAIAFTNINSYSYVAPTVDGDCGALVLGCGKTTTRRILGIHVGKVNKTGRCFSEPVFAEDLERFVPRTQGLVELPPRTIQEEPVRFVVSNQSFSVLGKVGPTNQIFLPTKTVFYKTPFFGIFGPNDKLPSVLSPKDPRLEVENFSPLLAGVNKYHQSGYFKTNILEICFERAKEYWGKPKTKPYILSWHQVINGEPSMNHMKHLNFGSSAGHPLVLEDSSKKKKHLFEGEPCNYVIKSKLLQERLDERIALGRDGIQLPDSLWCDTLKDELRPLAKIAVGKTRVFANGPIDFTMCGRKYGGHFFNHFYDSYKWTPSAVGMDCESGDWDDLESYLKEVSDCGFAGDFGRFDGSLAPQIMDMFSDLWTSYMSTADGWDEGCDNFVRTMVHEIIHTTHLCMDGVYICHGGNPSGNFSTVIINSFVNWMYFAYAWMELAPGPQYKTMNSFEEFVRIKVYGDDAKLAVHDSVASWYNMKTVSKLFAQYGIELLPPDKEIGEEFEVAPLDTFSFLKRKTRIDPDIDRVRRLACIDKSSIYGCINWNRKSVGQDKWLTAQDGINCALRFAFFHGREFFEHIRSTCIQHAERNELGRLRLLTWVELKNQYSIHGGIYEEAHCESSEISPTTDTIIEGTPHLGTVILQPEPTVQAPVTNKQPFRDSRARRIIPEQAWNVPEMAEKFSQFDHFQWTATQTTMTLLKQYSVPFDLIQNNTVSVPFANFTFARFHTLIQATSNGPKTSQGKLLFTFVPGMNKAEAAARHGTNLCAATAITNFGLGPNHSSGSIEIPFYNINSFMNIVSPDPNVDFVGTLNVLVVIPLVADPFDAISYSDITMYASFKNSEFHVPISQVLTRRRFNPLYMKELNVTERDRTYERLKQFTAEFDTISESGESEQYEEMTVEELRVMFPHIKIKHEPSKCQGSSSSKQSDDKTNTTNVDSHNVEKGHNTIVMGNLTEIIMNETAPEKPGNFNPGPPSIVTDMSGSSSQTSTNTQTTSPTTDVKMPVPGEMDKPSTTFRVLMEEEPTTNFMHGSGLNYAKRLDLRQRAEQQPDEEHFGTGEDEMDLRNMWQKPSYCNAIGTINSTSGAATLTMNARQNNFIYISQANTPVNTVIACGYISPVPELYDANIDVCPAVGTPAPKVYLSNLCYYSCKASWWSGALTYTFEFVCTEFHTIELVFTPHYGVYSVPTDLGAATDQYATYFKLGEGNTTFSVTLANIFQRRFQRIYNGGTPTTRNLIDSAIGVWSLRTLTTLNGPSIVNGSIQGLMYISGAPNFQAWGFYGNNKTLVPICGQSSEKKKLVKFCSTCNRRAVRLHDEHKWYCVDCRAYLVRDPRHEKATCQASNTLASGSVRHVGHLMTTGAPTPADSSHFGSVETNLHYIMKRMIPLGTFVDEQLAARKLYGTNGTAYIKETQSSDGQSIFQYPRVIGIHTAAEILSHGLPGWFSTCYRFYRGSYQLAFLPSIDSASNNSNPDADPDNPPNWRTYITVDTTTQYSTDLVTTGKARGGVPGTIAGIFGTGMAPCSIGTNPDTSAPAGAAVPFLYNAQQTGDAYNGTQPPGNFTPEQSQFTFYNSMPVSVSRQNCDFHNVVVPYLTEYPVLYVPQASASTAGATDSSLKTHSNVIFAIQMNTPNWYDMTGNKNMWRATYMLMGSIGDDFRMGGFLGPSAVTATSIFIPQASTGDTRDHFVAPTGDNYNSTAG